MGYGVKNDAPRQKKNNQAENQDAATNTDKNSKVPVPLKILTINVFFDGTNNNMFNIELRTKTNPTDADKELKKELIKPKTSYENDYSNVAVLYKACSKEKGVTEKIYIQGAGTTQYKTDDTIGLAGAWSSISADTGVNARVQEAIKKVTKLVKKNNANTLHLNVFGFSRGSFYARYFCAKIKEKTHNTSAFIGVTTDPCLISGLSHDDIHINFVGIFDTVSSEGFDNYNDVGEYHLNIGAKQGIKKIIHLTAQNDYRYHFALTHINTAISDGIGFECSFPGAHSDIGGGYRPDTQEDQYLSILDDKYRQDAHSGEIGWKWYQEKGYYKGDPTSQNESLWGDFKVEVRQRGSFHFYPVVKANRNVPSHDYQFVLANCMKQMAQTYMSIQFQGAEKAYLEDGITSMQTYDILRKIDDYASTHVLMLAQYAGKEEVSLKEAGLSEEKQKQLYHDYLHNSLEADNNFALGPNRGQNIAQNVQWEEDGAPRRAMINDN